MNGVHGPSERLRGSIDDLLHRPGSRAEEQIARPAIGWGVAPPTPQEVEHHDGAVLQVGIAAASGGLAGKCVLARR